MHEGAMGHDRLALWRGDNEEEAGYSAGARDGGSGRECDCCGEELFLTDEVFVLEVSEAVRENNQFFSDFLRDEEGDYQFRPYMMHFACWEEVLEELYEATRDQPPMYAEDLVLKCTCCESTIGSFEPFIASTFGEIKASARQPSGQRSAVFEPLDGLKPVCLLCIVHVIDDHFEDWEELVELVPETDDSEGEQDE